jgi:translation initiation factor IF-3
VVPTQRALQLAEEHALDLVEVAPGASPPVAKILDYGKYRYEQQQKDKEAKRRHRAVIFKEIRISPKIDPHDFETKARQGERFLGEGDKLKITVRFRGREMAHPDLGRKLLLQMGERLREFGTTERAPLLEGRQMVMVMQPIHRSSPPRADTVRPS